MTNQIQPVAADVTPTFTEFLASPEEKALEEKVYENLPTGELQQLIKSAQAGNQQALDKLCEQFRPLVEATARSYSFYTVLGEDGISICWVKLIEILTSYNQPIKSTFPGYLKQSLYNVMLDVVTHKGEVEQYLATEDDKIEKHSVSENFEEQFANNEALLQAILELTPKEQALLYNYYIEGTTLVKLSQRIGINLRTLKSQHLRIIKKLRIIFHKHQSY